MKPDTKIEIIVLGQENHQKRMSIKQEILRVLWIFHFIFFIGIGGMELPSIIKSYYFTDRKALFDSMQESPSYTAFNYSGRFYIAPKSLEDVENRMRKVFISDVSKLSFNIILSLSFLCVIIKMDKKTKEMNAHTTPEYLCPACHQLLQSKSQILK